MESCCFRWFKRLTSKHNTVTVAMRTINSRKIATITPIVRAISVRLAKLGVKEAVAIIVVVVVVVVVVVAVVVVVVADDDESAK